MHAEKEEKWEKTWDENENDEGRVNWTTLQEFTSRLSYDRELIESKQQAYTYIYWIQIEKNTESLFVN